MKQVSIFYISDMHCASCANTIEDALRAISGIGDVQVNYASGRARVTYNSEKIDYSRIKQIIIGLGYTVLSDQEIRQIQQLERHGELLQLKIKLFIGMPLTISIFLTMLFGPFFGSSWLMALLAAPIQFWVGLSFYTSAWRALKNRRANMDTLVVLGTSVAYFYSLLVVTFEQFFSKTGVATHLYFDASAVVIVLVLLGKYLEVRAKGRASSAIKKLMKLQPLVAMVQKTDDHGNEQWKKVAIEEVVVNDKVRVMPGDRIPLDGIIIEGESTIDESMLTGESKPVFKQKGAEVIGGTISKTGTFVMKVSRIGEQTTLARIIELVQNAQNSKAPVQRIVDKISAVFVPVVIVLALITFFVWFFLGPTPQFLNALVSTVSVLVIACPCALGLATPISIIAGIDRAAQEGILIKDVQVLEQATKITTVVFDKTGTITEGKQAVQHYQLISNLETIFHNSRMPIPEGKNAESFFAALVCSLNDLSNHPISNAVSAFLKQRYKQLPSYTIEQFTTLEGLGLKGTFNGHSLKIGTEKVVEKGEKIPGILQTSADTWSKEGMSVSYVMLDRNVVAVLGFSDVIRNEAAATIAHLKNINIMAIMLTGDNEMTAASIAKKVGIESFYANVKPEDKVDYVRQLQKSGKVVAMVGDGINDAPALAQADVGIAMGSGADVALETAGVALLHNDLSLVSKIITLSHLTMRNIKQNLVWAFGYNIILIPVAMGLLYPFFGIKLNPMLAGAAMAFSSVSVVFNALRLKRARL